METPRWIMTLVWYICQKNHHSKREIDRYKDFSPKSFISEKMNLFQNSTPHCLIDAMNFKIRISYQNVHKL